jgi:phage recombination protein Bet
MSNQIAEVKPKRTSLVEKMAGKFSIDPTKLMATLKATAFRQTNGPEVTDEQMAALLVVADQYGLNPFTREIYAFPDKRAGIVPVVGVDGWSRIINDHPASDGFEFRQSDKEITPEHGKPCPEWMEVVIHRKDRAHPIVVREYIEEVYRLPFIKDGRAISGPWQTHTRRFFRHKTLIQGARLAYGFSGIYDEDEAERIIEMGDVVIEGADQSSGTSRTSFVTVPSDIVRQVVTQSLSCLARNDAEGLQQIWEEFSSDEQAFLNKRFDSTQRSEMKKLLATLNNGGSNVSTDPES